MVEFKREIPGRYILVDHALSRLERDGYVKSQWEDLRKAHGDRRPPRRYYRITAHGERALGGALQRFRTSKPPRGATVNPGKA